MFRGPRAVALVNFRVVNFCVDSHGVAVPYSSRLLADSQEEWTCVIDCSSPGQVRVPPTT